MTFKITAANAAILSKQIDAFAAGLPKGKDFPVNFGKDGGSWWASYEGQQLANHLSFSGLVATMQQWVEQREQSLRENA